MPGYGLIGTVRCVTVENEMTAGCDGDRVRRVQGLHNVRDLGGLTGANGLLVRSGRLFRSDYPAFTDGAAVAELGLRTVVDLRRGTEAAVECVPWADHAVTYHRCPFSAGAADSWHARYAAYLTHRPESVVAAVRHVINPANHPVLFHCAAGKDRTGVLAGLVLSLLGVSRAEIVADYLLTSGCLMSVMERLAGIEMYAAMLADDAFEDQVPRAEHVNGFLDWLEGQDGAEAWLRRHGLEGSAMEAFRDAMLDSAR